MRTAIVIPTLNAVRRGLWTRVLEAVAAQDLPLEKKIVIDSSSDDATCAVAEARGWVCRKIRRDDFNHGLTRQQAVSELARSGIDTVIFLSQDVVLDHPEALSELTAFLWSGSMSGCYGRQRSWNTRTLEAWQRKVCYPAESSVKTLKDLPRLKLLTPFFSNAFSAWKVAEVQKYGGFVKTIFGEDSLLAAKILNQGGSVGYCSTAVAVHDHEDSLWRLFLRGIQVGEFHRQHPELLRQFGRSMPASVEPVPQSVKGLFGIKLAGYACGRGGDRLIPLALFLLMWILLIPAIVLYDFPQRDMVNRYAPMAEAFARGDWQFAFHPRVTPLLTIGAGIMAWLFSCHGFLACQLTSSLFLTIGIFPFYYGCKKIYGVKNAAIAGIFYALCPPFLRLGYYGLRETGSILGISLLFLATALLWKKDRSLKGFVTFVAAETLLLLSRGDVAFFALIACLMLLVWDTLLHRWAWRSIGAAAAILLLLSPLFRYNYRMIGYPVPEIRHAFVLRKLCVEKTFFKVFLNPHPAMPIDGAAEDDYE